jgi:hypothetical protein
MARLKETPLKRFQLLAGLLLAALTGYAAAQGLSISGYGTIGYAQSDRDFTYQRSIDHGGTFDRDSVLGVQGDLRLTPQWSATLQLKAAQSLKRDNRWGVTPAWAFVAWRPDDDWLVRAGRMRVPLYLHSESMDVGVTHAMARLPAEMYSIVPSTDYNGLTVAKTWLLGSGELSADLYSGTVGTTARFWLRDGLPPQLAAGARFEDVEVRSSGLVLTWRTPDSVWRAGLHRTKTRRSSGQQLPERYPFVQIAPGVGYYQVDAALPGPGLNYIDAVENTVFTLGVDTPLAPGWRVMGEYARMRQKGSELGAESDGGYLAVLHEMGRTTPYVSMAWLRSTPTVLGWQRNLTQTQLPAFVQGADTINAAMRAAGEQGYAADQRSWAVGVSYALASQQRLKVEYQRTRIGQTSRFVDTPAGQPTVSETSVGVWSASYNFSF